VFDGFLERHIGCVQHFISARLRFSAKKCRPIQHCRVCQFGLVAMRDQPMHPRFIVAIHQDEPGVGDPRRLQVEFIWEAT
jgi:hypothetical protein